MNGEILVSAIVSTYNSEGFIKGRIENLLQQTIRDRLEIIIINSGSEENEDLIIKKFLDHHSNIIYIYTEQRESIYKAWNRGIELARGKYITNTNTDDRLKKNAFEIMTRVLDSKPEAGIVYADQFITDIPNLDISESKNLVKWKRTDYSKLRLLSDYILGSQSLWRASLHFKDNLWFDEKYEVCGDYDFACRVSEKYDIVHIPKCLGYYYRAESNQNKEFQNTLITSEETYVIKNTFTRKYIESLTKTKLNWLRKKAKIYKMIPPKVFGVLKLTNDIIFPKKQMLSRQFMCWLGSILEEKEGNIQSAKRYLEDYLVGHPSYIIQKQNDHLLNLA